MREQILKSLKKAKLDFEEIISNFSDVLPKNITDGSKNSIDVEIPKFVNNFISILNASEQREAFPNVQSLEEAIDLFNNQEIDNSIAKAMDNDTLIGVGEKGNLSAKELLEASKFGIDSGTQLLEMQLSLGKMSKGEF